MHAHRPKRVMKESLSLSLTQFETLNIIVLNVRTKSKQLRCSTQICSWLCDSDICQEKSMKLHCSNNIVRGVRGISTDLLGETIISDLSHWLAGLPHSEWSAVPNTPSNAPSHLLYYEFQQDTRLIVHWGSDERIL